MAVEAPAAPGRAPGEARPRPKREREEEVLVWPDLVFVEFIAATLFTITFLLLSVFINAPLLNRANADVTPNPSKAPWYFLNLQELLLHMDKAWAGVLLPTIALVFFAVIPYIDRSREAQGIWFGTKYSVRITIIAALYATVRQRVSGRSSTPATARSSSTRPAGFRPATMPPRACRPALPHRRRGSRAPGPDHHEGHLQAAPVQHPDARDFR